MSATGSATWSSVHTSALSAEVSWSPPVFPGCQQANSAPCGSVYWASQPSPMTSMGSIRTVPPPSRTAAVVAWMSGLMKCCIQADVAPSSVSGPSAATVLPSTWKNPYPPASGPAETNSQPRTAS